MHRFVKSRCHSYWVVIYVSSTQDGRGRELFYLENAVVRLEFCAGSQARTRVWSNTTVRTDTIRAMLIVSVNRLTGPRISRSQEMTREVAKGIIEDKDGGTNSSSTPPKEELQEEEWSSIEEWLR